MKKQLSLFLLLFTCCICTVSAQGKSSKPGDFPTEVSVINANLEIFNGNVRNQLQVVELHDGQFDRISVLDKQGTVLIKKTVNSSFANMDVSQLDEGVYLLGLRSSSTLKEKTIKFVIRR